MKTCKMLPLIAIIRVTIIINIIIIVVIIIIIIITFWLTDSHKATGLYDSKQKQ